MNQPIPLSPEEKIGQLFFIGIPGPEVDAATSSLLGEIKPGGVCLFARNIKEASQTRALLDELRDSLPVNPLLSLDQEGGLVDRLRRVLTPMPAAERLRSDADAAELAGIIGESIRILGFNMDFAPVVDVIDKDRASASNGLHSRAFGRSKEEAAARGETFLHALELQGVIGCLKHFPGLGASKVDSHEELPIVEIDRDELESVDLYPYKRLIPKNIDAVMVGHAAFPKIDLQEIDQNGKLLPASLSFNFVTKLLRQQLGFAGVAITDDLEMGAIIRNYGIGEACVRAVLAGEDMLAICADPQAIRQGFSAISDAVGEGEISAFRLEESVGRVLQLKQKLEPPLPFDTSKLQAISARIVELNNSLI